MSDFSKLCPDCGKKMIYAYKSSLMNSIRKNRKCVKCSKNNTETLLKISKSWFKSGDRPKNADKRKGKTYDEIYGYEKSQQIKKEQSIIVKKSYQNIELKNKRIKSLSPDNGFKKGIKPCNYGMKMPFKSLSDDAKENHRLAMINLIKNRKGQVIPNYNKNACECFNKIMKEKNIHIQHAENGGEFFIDKLGYWVDGYDKENNTIYEYDEKRHFDSSGNLREKDIKRQTKITNLLNCNFKRIKYDDIL